MTNFISVARANFLCVAAIAAMLTGCTSGGNFISSPDGRLKVNFGLNQAGEPMYSTTLDNKTVIYPSKLGLELDGCNLKDGLHLISTAESGVTDNYSLKTGKQTDYQYCANEKIFNLLAQSGDTLGIAFRVSDDGFAFSYRINSLKGGQNVVNDEFSTFCFADSARAWLQIMAIAKTGWCYTNPSYEENYSQNVPVGTPCPWPSGWVYPALFQSNGAWVLVSETGLTTQYCGTRLTEIAGTPEYKVRFPMPQEVIDTATQDIRPVIEFPWQSPWRTVSVSANLKGIVESTIGTDLAAPAVEGDYSWVKPGHASWSWAKLKDESVVYDVQKRFVDYAARMRWEYCLVDVNWDRNIGYEKIAALAKYAATKGVGLILWYNSSGDWNTTEYTPKSRLLTPELREAEFSRLEQMGIKGIKVDFFAGDGQPVMQYYRDIFADAARHHLMVNCHGATLPRGWQRTYPNLVTMEAVKGFEYSTFTQEYQEMIPTQSCCWTFTRNVFDPMDFTPMSLAPIPGIERATTNAFELALPVLFLSGVQHFAETDDGMATQPDYVVSLLQDFPTTWDESQFIDGFPGKYFVAARKSGGKWYVAGINGEKTVRTLTLDLSEIGAATKAELFTDTDNKWQMAHSVVENPDLKAFEVTMQSNGGFVAVLKD